MNIRQWLPRPLLAGFLLITLHTAGAFDYAYLSDTEETIFGEPGYWMWDDTLWGPIRTNGCFHCLGGGPVLYAPMIMSCGSTETNCGDWNPFNWPEYVVVGARMYPIPHIAVTVRELSQGHWPPHYFDPGSDALAVVRINYNYLNIIWGTQGTPVDTIDVPWDEYPLFDDFPLENTFFFDCPIRISGALDPDGYDLIIGSNWDIGLDDNVIIHGTNEWGVIPDGATSRIALISEGNVVIRNTPANGRDNSEGEGRNQTDQNLTSIVITGMIAALNGSLTFAQQNDRWESYICGPPLCPSDERGFVHLNGALIQRRRGYVHRSNNGGTGYLMNLHWDYRLSQWDFSIFPDDSLVGLPDEIAFGEVPIGETAWDTLVIPGGGQAIFSGATATSPFYTSAGYAYGGPFTVPISFTPPQAQPYSGFVYFYLNGTYQSITLSGTGIEEPGAQAVDVAIYPNPFNAMTTFRLSLPEAGQVSIRLYDVLGREVETIADQPYAAGDHSIGFDGNELAAGVYFARVHAAGQYSIHKLLLAK